MIFRFLWNYAKSGLVVYDRLHPGDRENRSLRPAYFWTLLGNGFGKRWVDDDSGLT